MDKAISEPQYLTAAQAAEILGISVPTLYAYVSRGLLHSEDAPDKSRAKRYPRREVERLAARRAERRDPSKVAAGTLDYGAPVLESAITLIDAGRCYYRGHDVGRLARDSTLEEVAHLIWLGEFQRGPRELFVNHEVDLPEAFVKLPGFAGLEPIERIQILLPLAAVEDHSSYVTGPPRIARCSARILRRMAVAASGSEGGNDSVTGLSVAGILKSAWSPHVDGAVNLFNAALVLAADHEFNVSSFTARCVASAGTTPYEVITAGLAALRGRLHGGLSTRTETFLVQLWRETAGDPGRISRSLVHLLKQGDKLPGVGHPIYPGGDPRAVALLAILDEALPGSESLAWARQAARDVWELIDERPTIDFALAAFSLALELPAGAALATFALGRTVGWIGQAIEQIELGQLIRPRARYTGPAPS